MKKILITIMITMCLISFKQSYVNAAEYKYHGYIYEDEIIPNIFYKNKYNTLEEALVFKRSDSNKVIYSIEYENKLSGAGIDDYDDTFDYRQTNLTKEQTNLMNLIGYYGYNYQDEYYNHTDIKWYAITQYLIWQVEDENNLIGIVNQNGEEIFKEEIKEIESLIEHHFIIPDFKDRKFKMKTYDELTIIDQNNVIDEYSISIPNDLEYKIEDNNITLSSTKDDFYTLSFTKKDTRYANSCIFYISDEYRNAIEIGKYDTLSTNVIVTFVAGKIYINKSGEQIVGYEEGKFIYNHGSVNGSVYYLYAKEDIYNNVGKLLYSKDTKVSELTIGETNHFANLYLADYYVREISNAYPYLINNNIYDVNLNLDNNSQTLFFISDFQDISVSFTNLRQDIEYIDNTIKYTYEPFSNVQFGLFNTDDISLNIDDESYIITKDTLLGVSTSDENGVVNFALDIPVGKYYIKKLTEYENYYGNVERSPFMFIYNYGTTNQSHILMTYYNLLYTKDIIFQKSENFKEINIYDKNQTLIISDILKENTIFTLGYGDYYYQIDNGKMYSFTVDKNSENIIDLSNIENNADDFDITSSNNKTNDFIEIEYDSNNSSSNMENSTTEIKQNVFIPSQNNSNIKDDNINNEIEEDEEELVDDNLDDVIEDCDEETTIEEDKKIDEDNAENINEPDEENDIKEETNENTFMENDTTENSKLEDLEKVEENDQEDNNIFEFIEDKEDTSNREDSIYPEESEDKLTTISGNLDDVSYQELNVAVPATDKFDLCLYLYMIIITLSYLLFKNVKE